MNSNAACMRPNWSPAPASHAKTAGARKRAAARRLTQDAADRKAAHRDQALAERDEARQTQYLPAAGEEGPAALRNPRPFRVRPHQDTSATLRAAYPFLAEGGLGSEGLFIGQDMYSGSAFAFDAFELYRRGIITAPNMILAGIVGAGKSALIKSLYTRSIAFGEARLPPRRPQRRTLGHRRGGRGQSHPPRPRHDGPPQPPRSKATAPRTPPTRNGRASSPPDAETSSGRSLRSSSNGT